MASTIYSGGNLPDKHNTNARHETIDDVNNTELAQCIDFISVQTTCGDRLWKAGSLAYNDHRHVTNEFLLQQNQPTDLTLPELIDIFQLYIIYTNQNWQQLTCFQTSSKSFKVYITWKFFLLIWKAFRNTKEWRFSFWNILLTFFYCAN